MSKILVAGSRYTVCENLPKRFGTRAKTVLAGGLVRIVVSNNGEWVFADGRS